MSILIHPRFSELTSEQQLAAKEIAYQLGREIAEEWPNMPWKEKMKFLDFNQETGSPRSLKSIGKLFLELAVMEGYEPAGVIVESIQIPDEFEDDYDYEIGEFWTEVASEKLNDPRIQSFEEGWNDYFRNATRR